LAVVHELDKSCYDDVCVGKDENVPSIWFTDRPDIFACSFPYTECDVGTLAFDFCGAVMNVTGSQRMVCAHNLWRMYALKENLILMRRFSFSNATNFLGFTRSNDWFEGSIYLPGLLSKQLIWPLGDDFLNARSLKLLEIGSFEGGSATWFVRYMLSHPQSTLICVDPWSTEVRNSLNASLVWNRFHSNLALTGRADRVRVMRNDSVLALAELLHRGEVFDFIYVDGSHSVPDVLADISLSWRLLAVGGIMALDDVPWRNTRAIEVEDKKRYTFAPDGVVEPEAYAHCQQVGNSSLYVLEHAIAALLTHLPGCDVIYCGYQVAMRKVF